MMMYRWQAGEIVPDATLEERLGVTAHTTIADWLKQRYGGPVLEIGKEYYSIWMKTYPSQHDESCLIDVWLPGDVVMLIWCEHWGAMLACVKWLTELAVHEQLLMHDTGVAEAIDALVDGSLEVAQVDAKARLIASGYTADKVRAMEQRRLARQRADLKRRQEARAGGAS
jgi:hypothetical protein